MFGSLFRRKNTLDVFAPFSGRIVPLSDIPDPAFAQGMIGDGIGLIPAGSGNNLTAPLTATGISIFPTLHATVYTSPEGVELMVHFGIDTVELGGKGFSLIHQGVAGVSRGDVIMEFDTDFITAQGKSLVTPVVVTNMDRISSIEKMTGDVRQGELIMRISLQK